MPDLSGIPAVDVVIGLAFVYFLLSLVISSLTEAVSALFQLRWKTLRRGMCELFDTGTEEGNALWERFKGDPRIRALWKETGKFGKRGPSYIPPRVFALTLLDTLAPVDLTPVEDGGDGAAVANAERMTEDYDVVERAKRAAGSVKNPLLQKWMLDALTQVETEREDILKSLEASFDSVTNRISGWYKRYASIVVAVFAVTTAVALNVDSYAIGSRLWKDDSVRASIAARAANLTDATTCTGTPASADAEGEADNPVAQAQNELQQAAECVTTVKALGLPIGWAEENRPDSTWGWVGKFFGLVVTASALMLGAPFWFDTLSKLSRLRATGKPEGTAVETRGIPAPPSAPAPTPPPAPSSRPARTRRPATKQPPEE